MILAILALSSLVVGFIINKLLVALPKTVTYFVDRIDCKRLKQIGCGGGFGGDEVCKEYYACIETSWLPNSLNSFILLVLICIITFIALSLIARFYFPASLRDQIIANVELHFTTPARHRKSREEMKQMREQAIKAKQYETELSRYKTQKKNS